MGTRKKYTKREADRIMKAANKLGCGSDLDPERENPEDSNFGELTPEQERIVKWDKGFLYVHTLHGGNAIIKCSFNLRTFTLTPKAGRILYDLAMASPLGIENQVLCRKHGLVKLRDVFRYKDSCKETYSGIGDELIVKKVKNAKRSNKTHPAYKDLLTHE